ncbi:hypothetical protein BG015_008651 [Linnemannia schmuckeri]|uniref:Uncharacterized protein n=1 Tax=Linnemannia schmuckeri TaxID=64567 RepID=A0A9P5S049_9FUNG|nr:hypothetical protein BG015_008651 [Linnemannia schmuckeri]
MQSVSQSIPRCVLAQNYLERFDRTNNSSNNSTAQHINGNGDDLMLLDDRNSDLDEQYQQLVHLNGSQGRHNSSNGQHYQQDGIVRPKQQQYLQQEQVNYGRTTAEEEKDDRLQNYNAVASREHNLQRFATSTKSTSLSSLPSSPAIIARTNQHPSVPPSFLQVSPQHQQQLNQRHFEQSGGASGAYEYPPYHSHQTQHNRLHSNQIQHNHHQQQHQRYSRADMSRLEAMFPPLHDSVDDLTTSSSSSTTTSGFSLTTTAASDALMSALDQGLQRPSTPHTGLMVSPKPTRPQRLVPPPILIPKDIVHSISSPQQHQQRSTQQQRDKVVVAAPIVTQNQNQQHLPSPVPSTTSSESPSSLAIHLYVHHHHHHHPQESSTAVILQDECNPSSSSSGETASLSSNAGSASMVLLSPLTLPHPTMDHHLYQQQQQQQHLQGLTKSAAAASLPSPPMLTPEIEQSELPSPPFAQIVSLLPPLSVSSNYNNSNDALLTSPSSAPSPPLIAPSVTKTGPTSASDDTTSSLPWFNHRHSLAHITTKNQLNNNNHQYQQRRHRQHRYHQPRLQLPDSALASQLLSTISSKDLARLYVHAAHHLHSHQPIRRYVMMKMIMTQAELAQYGRLRAEMPRAPGPSTGAQPKRNGFGSPAQSGFEFRPKKPSRLGRYMYSAAAFVTPAPAARWRDACGRSWSDEEDMGMEVWNEKPMPVTKKKSTSLPWPQSLSSLVSLTKISPTKSTASSSPSSSKPSFSVSERNMCCSSRRLEELELGHDNQRRINGSVQQQQQSESRALSSSSRIRKRGGGKMYSEDDYEDGEGSEDTETSDDFEGEEEEKPSTYWTMLRSRSNLSRKRALRNSSTTDQHRKEARLRLNMHQSQDKEHQQYYQQQQKIISLQQLDPQVIIYTSSTKSNPTSSTSNKSKPHARRSGSATASFTETYGISGLLMLALFFVFLFLLEGTNHFYKVQSALLSIIL